MADETNPEDSIVFAFTTNALDREINNTLSLARRVEGALHPNAPSDERQRIRDIVTALEGVEAAAKNVECPDPFFGYFTVDKTKLTQP